MRMKLLLDTDIGSDIDDVLALLVRLRLPIRQTRAECPGQNGLVARRSGVTLSS